jgi:hypothetical protein
VILFPAPGCGDRIMRGEDERSGSLFSKLIGCASLKGTRWHSPIVRRCATVSQARPLCDRQTMAALQSQPHLSQLRQVRQNATSDRTAIAVAALRPCDAPILSNQFIRLLRKRNPLLAKAS